ncbi:hypothetical protein N7456_006973 [Penicillium angulare]|uniref:Uncharacterized protein n=1 Tax=Penicillium angulare TaxID=116970 RepID=A0A9W9KCP8_9EURO|nr:hypothetical protein N7456_006973 [Penicillium angulare]
MANQLFLLPSLAELQSNLRNFPWLFKLSDQEDINLMPTHYDLEVTCHNFFDKKSNLTPSEMFIAISQRVDFDSRALSALLDVINSVDNKIFLNREPEGLAKIVKCLRKRVTVLSYDLASHPLPAVLESVTPAYDGQIVFINWIMEISIEVSGERISREIKGPLGLLSRYIGDV